MKLKLTMGFLLIFIFIVDFTVVAQDNQLPKNVKIVSAIMTDSSLVYTVVDLSNNEIVIINFSTTNYRMAKKVDSVLRTGMFTNPDSYNTVVTGNAPNS